MTILRSLARTRIPTSPRSFSSTPRCLELSKTENKFQTHINCPKCAKPLPTPIPVCPSCSYISRVTDSVPYHTLFQLPLEPNPFVVDTAHLKRKYLEAQRLVHPDAWAVHGEGTTSVAHSLSDLVGRAWGALKDPLPRAEYILSLHGIEIAEADQSEDFDLISEIMDIREQLEDATNEEIEAIAEKNRDEIKKTCAEIESFVGEQDWHKAKFATIRLKYLEGIRTAANQYRPEV